jgi:DNA-directed RNA polymerase beta' subunit
LLSKNLALRYQVLPGRAMLRVTVLGPALHGMSVRLSYLPYFPPNSEEIEARGFVKNSFLTGLEPSEMYFVSEVARIGIMNTAITTAVTGYMHKRMVKVMEDVKVTYDGSVRNANNTIYQFYYGDGYDAGETLNTKLNNESVVNFIDLKSTFSKINHEFES